MKNSSNAPVPPVFSVIIPTYNRTRFLPDLIESIMLQTFQDFEIIIVDDGSTDDTAKVVSGYNDERIKYLSQSKSGQSVARNSGIKISRGKLITFVDSDDDVDPAWLESFYTQFQDPKVGAVCCGLLILNEDRSIVKIQLPAHDSKIPFLLQGLFRAGSFSVRRNILEEIDGYYGKLGNLENTEIGLRIIKCLEENNLKLNNILKPLLIIRNHTGERRSRDIENKLSSIEHFIQRSGPLLKKYPRELERYYFNGGMKALSIQQFQRAKKLFKGAVRKNPLSFRNWKGLAIAYYNQLFNLFLSRMKMSNEK